ncbi:MAG: peptidylprolyl isomerase, partial [Bacteroidia bacterium]
MYKITKAVCLLFASLGLSTIAFAQTSSAISTDPVIMTIDGKPISKSEFENVYKKNNGKDMASDKKSVKEYLELFTNFKLKVKEAEAMGLDTAKSFKDELAGYRKQLAAPYLTDKNVNEGLVTEAYERMKWEVRASHILIKCAEDALPKDTLAAYNRIMEYRKRAVKGEDFAKLAKESANEGDPSAKDNAGDLGYFTALQMVYPFENMAFNTKPGEISMPVRTRFGYHIIKVMDKRPSQGEILVAHIMIRLSKEMKSEDSANAKKKVFEIYDKLKKGEKFEDLASQFSEDKQSAPRGGQLSWFGAGKMPVVEFETTAFALKNNEDYSAPFMTRYGWHIVKRLDKKGLADFDAMKVELKQKVSKDSRSSAGRSALIARIKKENKFTETRNLKKKPATFPALDEIVSTIDSSYFKGKWSVDKAAKLDKEMFSLAGKKYTQNDFAKYLESHQTRRLIITDAKAYVIEQQYKNFVDEACIAYEESMLESKYPDFKNLLQEYRDGILLFELTDRKVWSKAVKDTSGLKEFYEKNKNNYLWD